MVIEERLRGGRKRAGWKMGLTTAQPPTIPIVGTLLSDMVIATASDLDIGSIIPPMVEAELVVRIGEMIFLHYSGTLQLAHIDEPSG